MQSPILVVHDSPIFSREDNDRFVRHGVTLVNSRYLAAVIKPPSGIMKKRDLFTGMKDLTDRRAQMCILLMFMSSKKVHVFNPIIQITECLSYLL